MRILEVMANSEDYLEDPLERLLDKESDEEFGAPEYKEHLADSLNPRGFGKIGLLQTSPASTFAFARTLNGTLVDT